MLLASPEGGENSYSGRLSIQGNGEAFNAVSEDLSFPLSAYDTRLYRQAGGQLEDQFAQMGLLRTQGGGDYILLLDGEQVILEVPGKKMHFVGGLCPPSEHASLQNEADKTRTILSSLCRRQSGTGVELPDYSGMKDLDPNDPEDLQILMEMSEEYGDLLNQQSRPAWYPGNLIPMVNQSVTDGYMTLPMPDEHYFKIYNTQYYEDEDIVDIIGPYQDTLSAYDNYKEYMDYENSQAVFLFTMGKYTVQVNLTQQSIKLTGVNVQIY